MRTFPAGSDVVGRRPFWASSSRPCCWPVARPRSPDGPPPTRTRCRLSGKPVGYQPSDFPIDLRGAGRRRPDRPGRARRHPRFLRFVVSRTSSGTSSSRRPAASSRSAPATGTKSGCMESSDDPIIEDNAFYCPGRDEIAYWRPLLQRYADEYSDMQVGLVLAHELGHAIQAREGVFDVRSIVAETQADCFAGVWAASVARGENPHFAYDPANLDETLLAWALELPSEVGSDPDARGSTAARSTGSAPCRRVTSGARPPAGTTSTTTGCSPRPSSPRTSCGRPTRVTCPSRTRSRAHRAIFDAVLHRGVAPARRHLGRPRAGARRGCELPRRPDGLVLPGRQRGGHLRRGRPAEGARRVG